VRGSGALLGGDPCAAAPPSGCSLAPSLTRPPAGPVCATRHPFPLFPGLLPPQVNQIGSLSESIKAVKMSKEAGWGVMTSHRCVVWVGGGKGGGETGGFGQWMGPTVAQG
jgi:hypothetical protein